MDPLATAALDAPLPAEIAGGAHGWLTRYRQYPVFSPRWARLRARSLGVVVALVCAFTLGAAVFAADGVTPWGALVQVSIGVVLPLFGGPWLGSQVRRRALAPAPERVGLVAAVLGVVLVVVAFNEWLAEPVKQQIAERTGHVDANGQRKRVALTIGVLIRSPDEGAVAAAPAGDPPGTPHTRPTPTTHLASAFLAFCLAGGFALPRWRISASWPVRRPSGARPSCACRCWPRRSSRTSCSTRWPACAARSAPTRRVRPSWSTAWWPTCVPQSRACAATAVPRRRSAASSRSSKPTSG
jgi:hypothetical protein